MATRQQLIDALRKADQAGDTASAQRFAAMLKAQNGNASSGQGPAPTPQGDNAPQPDGYGALLTGIHNFEDTATFGLGDHAAALLATGAQGLGHLVGADQAGITAAPASYSENLANIRGNADVGSANNPTAAIAGDVGGLFAGGGAIGGLVKGAKALPLVGKAAEVADAALSARVGKPVANVARAALAGGTGGAVDSAAHGGNEDQDLAAAATGAIAGPIVGKIGGAIARRLAPVADRAMRLLADKIGETPAVLQAAYSNFQRATGRVPTMAELMGMKSRGELGQVASDNPTVGVALNQASTAADITRPGKLATNITNNAGGPVQDVRSLVTARDARMDASMKPIRDTAVPVDQTHLDLLNDPRVRNATAQDPELRKALMDTIKSIGDTGSGELTINQIDSLRQSLRSRQAAFANVNNANHNSQVARQFGNIADEVSSIADQHVPDYKSALNQFTSDQGYIDSFQHGFAGRSLGEADDPSLIRALGTAHGQQGHAAGVMSRLANRAGDSEAGANATALDLTQPGTIRAVTEAVGARAANRLAEGAAFERRSKDALDQMAPNRIQPQDDSGAITHGAHAAAALTYHSPTAIGYHLSRIFGTKLKMSPAVQAKVAQYLADPRMTQTGIRLLERAGAANADIRRLQTAISATTGAKAGEELAGGQ